MLRQVYGAMIVAMRAMRKVQVAIDEIIDVVTVRNGVMAAASAVTMTGLMSVAGMARCASGWIGWTNGERMFIHMVLMQVMEVAVVQVILMIVVMDDTVTAIGPVPMRVSVMNLMGGHADLLG